MGEWIWSFTLQVMSDCFIGIGIVLEHPSFFPGTHKTRNYLKDVGNLPLYLFKPYFLDSTNHNFFLLMSVALYCDTSKSKNTEVPFFIKRLRNEIITNFCSLNASVLFSSQLKFCGGWDLRRDGRIISMKSDIRLYHIQTKIWSFKSKQWKSKHSKSKLTKSNYKLSWECHTRS